MYKYTDNTQSNFLDFNQPIGLHMNPENRWVKMADAIPWEVFEKKYSRLFKGKNGRVAKPLRLALGSLIIQTKYQYSDRELVEQLTENPYYQYFIGLPGYQEEPPMFKVSDTHFAATWLLDERAPKVTPPSPILKRWEKWSKMKEK